MEIQKTYFDSIQDILHNTDSAGNAYVINHQTEKLKAERYQTRGHGDNGVYAYRDTHQNGYYTREEEYIYSQFPQMLVKGQLIIEDKYSKPIDRRRRLITTELDYLTFQPREDAVIAQIDVIHKPDKHSRVRFMSREDFDMSLQLGFGGKPDLVTAHWGPTGIIEGLVIQAPDFQSPQRKATPSCYISTRVSPLGYDLVETAVQDKSPEKPADNDSVEQTHSTIPYHQPYEMMGKRLRLTRLTGGNIEISIESKHSDTYILNYAITLPEQFRTRPIMNLLKNVNETNTKKVLDDFKKAVPFGIRISSLDIDYPLAA